MLLENQTYPEDVRVRNEAEALAHAGWSVTVVAPRRSGQPSRATVDGVRVRRFRLPQSGGGVLGFLLEYTVAHVQLFLRGLDELRRGAEVVHLHNPPDTLFPIGLLARALGRSVVYDHHDLSPELFVSKFGSSPAVRVLAAAQRTSFRTATIALVTNESQREVAVASGADAARVRVVRNGPRERSLSGSGDPRPGVLERPRLVFVGELASQDGVMELPDLLEHPRLRGAELTIVGDGPDRRALEERLAARGSSARVRFEGWVPHSDVGALIAGADVCVDPAPCNPLNHRSTMVKIAEYMAAARPVVAYELVETRRTAGEAALYAPCGDPGAFGELVSQLAEDGEERLRRGRRGRERALELVWERSEQVLLKAYSGLGGQLPV